MRTETIIISLIALWLTSAPGVAQALTPVEQLGKFNLSPIQIYL